MKRLHKIVFYTFLVSTISILAFAFWIFSEEPNKEQIAKAFPLDSYQVFTKGKNVTLYFLEPSQKNQKKETFHKYTVLEKTEIKEKSFQSFLKNSFIKSITNKESKCFNPRHGLRISDGKQKLDIIICFECSNFKTYYKDKEGFGSINEDTKTLFSNVLETPESP